MLMKMKQELIINNKCTPINIHTAHIRERESRANYVVNYLMKMMSAFTINMCAFSIEMHNNNDDDDA